jgi:hypothetical protein
MKALVAAMVLAVGVAAGVARAQECDTRLDPETAAALQAQERAGAYRLPAKRGEMQLQHTLLVPVTFHIVRRTDGTGGISTTDVTSTLNAANNWWAPAGIQYFQSGGFRYTNDDSLYSAVNTDAEFDQLFETDVVANTINVYFINAMPGCGRASFTTMPHQGVAVRNDCTTQNNYPTTLAHELGHYLDLYHTHETAFGVECPDGSNCSSAGDKVCDTAADPDVSRVGFLSGCTYVGTAMACGGQAYSPDATNLMSYGGACRDHFTRGQQDRALATLINVRPGLIQAPGLNVTWLDFGSVGPWFLGTFTFPFNDLVTAEAATNPGGTVVIKAGSTSSPFSFTKALRWDSFRGVAQIGGH